MKMLLIIYSGSQPRLVSALLEHEHVGGYTEFGNVRGVGTTGRRVGTRAWPGESTLFLSVVADERKEGLVARLHEEARRLPAGERLHVAVLPTESYV